MRVALVTPSASDSLSGNRTTALRWKRILEDLGHRVEVGDSWTGEDADLLVALHARKSFDSIERWAEARPSAPLVVALTGTDLYRDLDRGTEVLRALELASRVVALQPAALERLPARLRGKVHVILQSYSVGPPPSRTDDGTDGAVPPVGRDDFLVCVLSHVRPIKDPLRTALATRRLPAASRIVVHHAGAALDAELAVEVRAESGQNPRYTWLGPLPFSEARALLATSRLLVLSSLDEGGANVVSEAIGAGVPILSSDIPGSRGLLGVGYEGYFPPGDDATLARLLVRAESDAGYLERLRSWCVGLRPRFSEDVEREAWRRLLEEASGSGHGGATPA